jgi:hypothetical protein
MAQATRLYRLAVSVAFSLYLAHFGSYIKACGPLATVGVPATDGAYKSLLLDFRLPVAGNWSSVDQISRATASAVFASRLSIFALTHPPSSGSAITSPGCGAGCP